MAGVSSNQCLSCLTNVDLLGIPIQLRHAVEEREASAYAQKAMIAEGWGQLVPARVLTISEKVLLDTRVVRDVAYCQVLQ